MNVTTHEINDKQFHDAWRGYNQGEVDDFLDRVAETIDRLQRENADLTKRVAELDQAVAASRETEEMLSKTLVTAQQAAEEAIAKARAQAQELINEAEARAQSSEQEARERLAKAETDARAREAEAERELQSRRQELDERISALRSMESKLKQRLREFLEEQMHALETLTGDEHPAPPQARAAATPPAGDARGAPGPASPEPAAPERPERDAPGAVRAEPSRAEPSRAVPAATPPASDDTPAGGRATPEDDIRQARQRSLRDFLRKQD
jgi:DivIVA domain-containing protein